MNSDSSSVSSRASSPDVDELYLRDLHHHHHYHHHHSVSSTQSEVGDPGAGSEGPGRGGGSGGGGGGGSSRGGASGGESSKYKLKKQLSEQDLQQLRLKINGRERKRMHDLNLAMDGLREVMPYAHGPSVRKLSKIATLLLARNYILMLTSSLEEMKRLLGDLYGGHHSAFHCGTTVAHAAHAAAAAAASGAHPTHSAGPAAAAAAHPLHAVHPLLGSALSSAGASALSASLPPPPLGPLRGPPHPLLKTPAGPPPAALPLGGAFQHWAGLPCPCGACQMPPPPPPPHLAALAAPAGLARLATDAKDLLK